MLYELPKILRHCDIIDTVLKVIQDCLKNPCQSVWWKTQNIMLRLPTCSRKELLLLAFIQRPALLTFNYILKKTVVFHWCILWTHCNFKLSSWWIDCFYFDFTNYVNWKLREEVLSLRILILCLNNERISRVTVIHIHKELVSTENTHLRWRYYSEKCVSKRGGSLFVRSFL